MRRKRTLCFLVAAACAAPASDATAKANTSVSSPSTPLGSFQLTFYWVADESDPAFHGPSSRPLFDPQCRELARVSNEFARAIRLEGTGRLRDGRVLNVEGRCSCRQSPCYFEVDEGHPWGAGVRERALVPFRSVAVDPDRVAIGTRLYAPALDGLTVPALPPDRSYVHDGCLIADDVGGAIEGRHLDWFVGTKDAYRTLVRDELSRIDVFDGDARCRDR